MPAADAMRRALWVLGSSDEHIGAVMAQARRAVLDITMTFYGLAVRRRWVMNLN